MQIFTDATILKYLFPLTHLNLPTALRVEIIIIPILQKGKPKAQRGYLTEPTAHSKYQTWFSNTESGPSGHRHQPCCL